MWLNSTGLPNNGYRELKPGVCQRRLAGTGKHSTLAAVRSLLEVLSPFGLKANPSLLAGEAKLLPLEKFKQKISSTA